MLVTVRETDPGPKNGKAARSRKATLRPGAVLLKYFQNIAGADLNALFPDVRVVMSLRDQLTLGVPALIGGIPILLKLASTLTVLFLIAGFYLGLSNSVRDEEWAGALAALSGLVALGGFFLQQWIRFQRQTLLHQKAISDTIYFRNVNNNAGVFDTRSSARPKIRNARRRSSPTISFSSPADSKPRRALDRRSKAGSSRRSAPISILSAAMRCRSSRSSDLLRRDDERLSVAAARRGARSGWTAPGTISSRLPPNPDGRFSGRIGAAVLRPRPPRPPAPARPTDRASAGSRIFRLQPSARRCCNRLSAGPEATDIACAASASFHAVDAARHDDVGEHEIERFARGQKFQGGLGGAGMFHRAADAVEHGRGGLCNVLIVFDQQHFASPLEPALARCGFGGRFGAPQEQRDRGSVAGACMRP